MSANDMTDHDVVEDERVESVTVDEDVIDDDVTDEAVTDDDATDEGDRDEGDIAADFIEELLDIADIDGDLDIDVTGGRTYISVTADGESNLDRIASPRWWMRCSSSPASPCRQRPVSSHG